MDWRLDANIENPYNGRVGFRFALIGVVAGGAVGLISKETVVGILEVIINFFYLFLTFFLEQLFLTAAFVFVYVAWRGTKKLRLIILPLLTIFIGFGFFLNRKQYLDAVDNIITPIFQGLADVSGPLVYLLCGSVVLDAGIGTIIAMGIFYRRKKRFDHEIKRRSEEIAGKDFIEINRA